MSLDPSKYLDTETPFQDADFGLDKRLMKSVARLGYVYPTLVQTRAIPLALAGKDLLVRAKTGSGKTAAYGLALLQKLLQIKGDVSHGRGRGAASSNTTLALVLVPTRELVDQTAAALAELGYYCTDMLRICALGTGSMAEQASRLSEGCDVVVGTPAKVVAHLKAGTLRLKQGAGSGAASSSSSAASGAATAAAGSECAMFIIDEADLVLSYGYEADVRSIVAALPRICQSLLCSATLSSQLEELKRLVLHNAAILKLEEGLDEGTLTQLYVRIPRADKYLLLYALLKLRLIAGKALIFTADVDACFKLKLFLERFSIPAAVMNAELPANSRRNIISQFNAGLFDLLIATDEGFEGEEGEEEDEDEEEEEEGEGQEQGANGGAGDDDDDGHAPADGASATGSGGSLIGKKRKRQESGSGSSSSSSSSSGGAGGGKRTDRASRLLGKDAEYGVARGVDFRGVSTVVNFDFPVTARSYTHRIGRTARGGASGVALSLLPPEGVEPEQDALLAALHKSQPVAPGGQPSPSPLPFDVSEVEGFRYRVSDMLRSVTPAQIKEARLTELKREILASEALKAHFEDQPRDLALLQHEKPLAPSRIKPHLKDVPSYLLPPTLKAAVAAAGGDASGRLFGGGKGKKGKRRSAAAAAAEAVAQAGSAAEAAGDGKLSASRAVALSQAEVYSARRNNKTDPLKAFTVNAGMNAAASGGAGGAGGGSGRPYKRART